MAELVATTTWNRQALYRNFDWVNDEIRIILMSEWNTLYRSYTSEVSYANIIHGEVKGHGYIAGGLPLAGKSISPLGYQVRYRADPVSWLEFAGTARSALIVNWEAEDNINKWLMAMVDFGEIAFGNISPILIRWNSNIALQSRLVLETT